MAKGQKRSNRETKKPKQEKKAAVAEPSSLTTRLRESQEKAAKGKK
ncbi:MAG: hypothetical protein R6V44_16865 [Paracoccaceae bacterium]